jgi:hypothetical protein
VRRTTKGHQARPSNREATFLLQADLEGSARGSIAPNQRSARAKARASASYKLAVRSGGHVQTDRCGVTRPTARAGDGDRVCPGARATRYTNRHGAFPRPGDRGGLRWDSQLGQYRMLLR